MPLEEAVRRAARRLTGAYRHQRHLRRRARQDRLRAQRPACRHRPRTKANTSSPPTCPASSTTPATSISSPTATWPSSLPPASSSPISNGNRVERPVQRILWDPIQAEKGGYKHFMLKEIFEQPRAIRDTTLGRISLDSGKVFLERDEDLRRRIPPARRASTSPPAEPAGTPPRQASS